MKDFTLREAVAEARKRWGESGGAMRSESGVHIVGVWNAREAGERPRIEVRGAGLTFRGAFELIDEPGGISVPEEKQQ